VSETFKMEYRVLAKDGGVVWLHDEARVLSRAPDGRATQFQGVQIDITERMDAEDERQRTIDQLRTIDQQRRQLLTHVVTTQDEERRRIALDIHDDTIQAFSALSIRMETLGRSRPEIREDERFVEAERAVADSIKKLRHLIFELHPLTLEGDGLVATIRAHLEQLAKEPAAPRFELRSELTAGPPFPIGAAVYRIAREAITNAMRHSGASRVAITFEERDAGLFVQVEDDGVGFDPDTVPTGHLGLASIRERAELAGGWSRIESEASGGTIVSCWLPADWLPAGSPPGPEHAKDEPAEH
jgi:signal transduction histidine kinase